MTSFTDFKVGEVVRCLRDYPAGARIKAGQLATVVEVGDKGAIRFKTADSAPRWHGRVWNFESTKPKQFENK